MLSHHRKSPSSRNNQKNQKMKTWFLSVLVLVMAALAFAGPQLFHANAQAPTTAPAPSATAPHVTVAPGTAVPGANQPHIVVHQVPANGQAPHAPGTPGQAPTVHVVNGPPPGAPVPNAAPQPSGTPPLTLAKPAPPPATPVAEKSAGGEAVQLPWGKAAIIPLWIVFFSAILALIFGGIWLSSTLSHDAGSERMQGVAAAVQEGAMAYLMRQVKTMIPLVIAIGIGLGFLYNYQYSFMHDSWKLGLGVALAFLAGVTASYLAGYVGMGVAVRGNVRVANAALSSFKKALEIAFQAGAVSGMFTVGLGLLGATIIFAIFQSNAMFVLVGFGFGGSLAALFMRVGGGIFTKAADVGADLVGKVEANIPEDDPRNAATIADNVGDNVGDCAGMAADVFESYEVTLVAAIILAAAVGGVLQSAGFGSMAVAGTFTANFTLSLVIFALLVRAVGVVASIVGVLAVRGKDDPNMNPMVPINTGFFVSALIAMVGFFIVGWLVFGPGGTDKGSKFDLHNPKYDFSKVTYALPASLSDRADIFLTKAIAAHPGTPPMTPSQIEEQKKSFHEQLVGFADTVQKNVAIISKANPNEDITFDSLEKVRQTAVFMTSPPAEDSPASAANEILLQPAINILGSDGITELVSSIQTYNRLKASDISQYFWLLAFLATTIGLALTQVIGKLTEYFTAEDKKPVTEIATAAKTGPATLILTGLAEGLESAVWGVVAIAATIIGAFYLFPNLAMAAYAIALTGLGLLATTGYVLAMDTYGPISDNANGIFEMSGALKNADGSENKEAHNIVNRLDMVGNTTKALTKGFAIATAVIAAVALYRSFLDTVASKDPTILVRNIQVNLPDVFVGLLIGGAVPFLFSSFAIRAVSRAAMQLVEEVRRQFRTIPGIWEYTGVGEKGKPDYARCVAISTAAAQKELLGPGLLAVFAPIFVGFALGAYALGGFLAGAILVGQLMAVFMSNTGGAWDNAKKKIEDGYLGGKGTEAHKAGVIGDTVGDPLKDTAGPALNPMIKVMNLVSILIAPTAVVLQTQTGPRLAVVLVSLLVLIGAVMFSKRDVVNEAAPDEAPTASH